MLKMTINFIEPGDTLILSTDTIIKVTHEGSEFVTNFEASSILKVSKVCALANARGFFTFTVHKKPGIYKCYLSDFYPIKFDIVRKNYLSLTIQNEIFGKVHYNSYFKFQGGETVCAVHLGNYYSKDWKYAGSIILESFFSTPANKGETQYSRIRYSFNEVSFSKKGIKGVYTAEELKNQLKKKFKTIIL